jgi:hypothetical protein
LASERALAGVFAAPHKRNRSSLRPELRSEMFGALGIPGWPPKKMRQKREKNPETP